MSKRVTYTGPPDQLCHELGYATNSSPALEPGKTYSVSDELADRLVESSPHFDAADKKPNAKVPAKGEEGTQDA